MKSKCYLLVKGLNTEKMINTMLRKGIPIELTKQGKGEYIVGVEKNSEKKAVETLTEMHYDVRVLKYTGLNAILKGIKAHFVIIILAVVALVYTVYCGTRIGDMIIVDNGVVEKEIVTQLLGEMGVMRGVPIKSINIDSLENRLCVKLPQAEYVIISFKGNRLVVTLTEKNDTQPIIDNKQRDIVAFYDGVITRIVSLRGTPLVSIGQSVKKGDVLIKGELVFADGSTMPVRAEGRVYAQVEVIGESIFNEYKTVYVPSGSVFRYTTYLFCGREIGRAKVIPYDFYETAFNDFPLSPMPMLMRRVTVRELVAETVKQQLSECLAELKEKALKDATALLFFEPQSVTYTVVSENKTVVYAIIKGETDITLEYKKE